MITNEDIAWAAGLIDGEGCIFIAKKMMKTSRAPSFSLGCKVSMGHEETVKRLQSIFGVGSFHIVKQKKYNDAWTWLVQSQQCLQVLRLIYPHCITKKAEIELAFEFAALPLWHGGRWRGSMPEEYIQVRMVLHDRMAQLKPRNRFRVARQLAGTYNPPGRKASKNALA